MLYVRTYIGEHIEWLRGQSLMYTTIEVVNAIDKVTSRMCDRLPPDSMLPVFRET